MADLEGRFFLPLTQELNQAHDEEGRTDKLLSLLLPVDVIAAVKSSDADSLCSAEKFQVRRLGLFTHLTERRPRCVQIFLHPQPFPSEAANGVP